MPEFIEQVSGFVKGFFAGGISVTAVILFFLFLWVTYPDNFKIVLSQIWHILSFIFKKWAGRKYVKTHLEGTLGKRIEEINKEVRGLDAEKIKIVMVQTSTREAFIKEKTLVIRLQRKENHDENLVNVAVLYTEHCLYKKLELHLDEEQRQGFNLYTEKSFLKDCSGSALQFFHKNYYLPAAKDNQKVQKYFEQLERVDEKGLFYSVFVQEMIFLGNKAYFKKKPAEINKEVERFVNFLETFAERTRGDLEVEKTFSGVNIKMAFILVALKEKRELGMSENYVRYIENLLKNGTESYYLLGRGHNIQFVNEVASAVESKINDLKKINNITYKVKFDDGETASSLCVLFRNKNISELQDYETQQTAPLPFSKKATSQKQNGFYRNREVTHL